MKKMRRLTASEKEVVLDWARENISLIKKIMGFFKIFGGFQIVGLFIAMFSAPKTDIPFMIIGGIILYLVYFKFTSFLSNQNTWMQLIKRINEGTEVVYDGILIDTYYTKHGDSHSSKEFMAHVNTLFDGKVRSCNAASNLKGLPTGTPVAIVCFNIAGTGEMYCIKSDKSKKELDEGDTIE